MYSVQLMLVQVVPTLDAIGSPAVLKLETISCWNLLSELWNQVLSECNTTRPEKHEPLDIDACSRAVP